jgi:glycosyltransferase involved in cell wall biosynthesis
MKIVIDATSVAHGSRAIRRHSKNLIETIIRRDAINDYKLLYVDWRRQYKRYVSFSENRSVREHVVPVPSRLLNSTWQKFSLPKAEWFVGEFDIFYATDLYFPPSQKGLVLGTVRGIVYHMIEDKLDPDKVVSLKKGLAYTLKHADYLLAVSNQTKNDLIERLDIPADRIYVVSHGVDPCFKRLQDHNALSKRLNEKWKFSSQYILYVGVIGHHKNIMGLLRAFSILRKSGFEIPLVLAGPPGSAWEEVKAWIAKNDFKNSIYLTGLIDQDSEELIDLYNGSSLFVFPSFYEGWTSPPLEAMACGTPVITSNCSSLPETVGDAAIKVDPNNTEDLAYEMERVLSDKMLQSELINKGFDHIALHTWEKAAAKLIQIFTDIQKRGHWERQR